jgi:hypothetical protein
MTQRANESFELIFSIFLVSTAFQKKVIQLEGTKYNHYDDLHVMPYFQTMEAIPRKRFRLDLYKKKVI